MADRLDPSVINLYRRRGAAWANLRGKVLTESAWLDRFCALLPIGGDVLDIGCGSGLPLAGELVRRGFEVTGVDGAPEMLALFRHNVPNMPAILSDMRELALGRRFSGLLAWDSFFHLSPDDQRKMFARFAAHTAPGGALMLTSGPRQGIAIGELDGEPLYHASLDPREYQTLLAATGFEFVGHVAQDPGCGQRSVWLAQRLPA